MKPLDLRLANGSAAVLYVSAALLLALITVIAGTPEPLPAGIIIAIALVLAGVHWLLGRSGRLSSDVVAASELVGVVLIATLVATSGGADSPYPPYYLLTVVHCAIFQRRWHFGVVLGAAVLAFLAPFAYDPDSAPLREVALVTIPPVIAMGVVINTIVAALGVERQRMAEREAEALRIADSDELTGVGNYRMFWRSLQNEIARARRYGGGFSLVLMDLDGFKEINDRLGHVAGDACLRSFAESVRDTIRTGDRCFRWGGDELVVLFPDTPIVEAQRVCVRIRAAVRTSSAEAGEELQVSYGVAELAPGTDDEGLVRAADAALMTAKAERRSAASGRFVRARGAE